MKAALLLCETIAAINVVPPHNQRHHPPPKIPDGRICLRNTWKNLQSTKSNQLLSFSLPKQTINKPALGVSTINGDIQHHQMLLRRCC